MKCESCGKEHDGSCGSGRFCSRSCSNKRVHTEATKKKISKTLGGKGVVRKLYNGVCLNCSKPTTKVNKYCCKKCQNDFQYKEYIRKWQNDEVDGVIGNGGVSGHIRRYLWKKYDSKCCECGWNTPNPVTKKPFLEVEHIDGDCFNNKEKNLKLICPNCHSLTETYKALNSGNGKRKLRVY